MGLDWEMEEGERRRRREAYTALVEIEWKGDVLMLSFGCWVLHIALRVLGES